MNPNRFVVGLGVLLAVFAVATSLWVGRSVGGLRADLAAVRQEIGASRSETSARLDDLGTRVTQSAASTANSTSRDEVQVDPFTGVDLKRASDIQARVDEMVSAWKSENLSETAQIEGLANLLVELDEWLFAPEEQPKANSIIAKEIALLRRLIKSQVAKLAEVATSAGDGKKAAEVMAQINRLLSLYPAPATATEQAELDQLTARILSTSRRVEEIRYLRYNQWAISQIEDGLKRYRTALAIGTVQDMTKLVRKDRDQLRGAAIATMSTIDTGFLNPAAMDLYNYAYAIYRDAMGTDDDARAKLAKGFADPSIKRLTPADF